MLEEKEERRNEKKNAFFSLPFFLFRRLAAAIQQQLQQQGVIITKERERGRKQEKSDFFCSLPPRPPLHFSFPQKKKSIFNYFNKKKSKQAKTLFSFRIEKAKQRISLLVLFLSALLFTREARSSACLRTRGGANGKRTATRRRRR